MDIELHDVTVDFTAHGIRVLDQFDLAIGAGEQVALLGPSGAGKSTLLRVILGGVRPVAGQVRVGGLNPFGSRTEVTRIRQATGIVRQRDDLVRGLSARANILMGEAYRWRLADWLAVLRGGTPAGYRQRLHGLAVRHEIDDLLDTRIEYLSGGQRQRVALARALLSRPRLLLADESTAGLDPTRAAAALAHLRDAEQATLLVATHDLAIAHQLPRVVALRDGRVVFDGSELDEDMVEEIYGSALAAEAAVGEPAEVIR
jgi:ABC-type phosphate/phosphonate transport system ATPase subunit